MLPYAASLRSLPPRIKWPIVGRTKETEELRHLLDSGSGAVLVVGPPGMGKSTVVASVLATAKQRAAVDPMAPVVFKLPVPREDSNPLQYFAQFLSGDLREASSAEIIAGLIAQELGSGQPLFHAEDVHFLDPGSATVLALLVADGVVQVIATCREDPGLPAALDALWRSGQADRKDLTALDYEEVRMILRQALEEPCSNDMAYRLWAVTKGNPLHVRELLYSIVESGDVVFGGHAWLWTAPVRANRRLIDLLAKDVSSLTGPIREVVDLVALAESVPLSVVTDIVGDEELRDLVNRGILTMEDSGLGGERSVAIGHPLYAESLRAGLYPQRRRELFDRLPQRELHSQGSAGLSRWVDWALECGVIPSVDTLLHAGAVAEAMAQSDRVAELATLALKSIGETEQGALTTALILRARARRDLGLMDAAEEDCLTLDALTEDVTEDNEPVIANVARIRADMCQIREGDPEGARAALLKAEKRLPPDSDYANILAVEQLARLAFAGRHAELLESVDAALVATDHPVRLTLLPAKAFALGQSGRAAEGFKLAEYGLSRVSGEHADFPIVRMQLLSARYWTALWMGSPAAASHFPELADFESQRLIASIIQAGTGYTAMAFGAWELALPEFRGALSRFALGASTGLEPLAWAGLAVSYAHLGNFESARSAREHYLALVPTMDRTIESDAKYRLLLVGFALGDKDLNDQIDSYLDWAQSQNLLAAAMWGLHLAVIAAQQEKRMGYFQRLTEVASKVEGDVAVAMLAHASAILEGEPNAIQTATAGLSAVGYWIPPHPNRVTLTPRQREIASLVVIGMSNKAIAEKLTISVRTVDTHVANLFARLDVVKRADLVLALANLSQ